MSSLIVESLHPPVHVTATSTAHGQMRSFMCDDHHVNLPILYRMTTQSLSPRQVYGAAQNSTQSVCRNLQLVLMLMWASLQVTIGHGAILHACTIEDEVLVGMGAKVLDGAIVRRGAIVGGGAVVAPGTEVPSGQVWAGCPARYLRDVDASESAFLAVSAHNYADLSREHWNEVTKVHLVRPAASLLSPGPVANGSYIGLLNCLYNIPLQRLDVVLSVV